MGKIAKMIAPIVRDAIGLVGVGCFVAGFALISTAAALMMGGVLLVLTAVIWAMRG